MNKEKSVRGSVPLYLNKINSDKKAIECANILEAMHSTHAQRLWLCGFMKFCGYSMPEVINIISKYCRWVDYDARTTAYQVSSIYHQRPAITQNHSSPRPRKWSLSPLEVLKIRYQRSVTLSNILCEENKHKNIFPHSERLSCSDFNPSAEFLRK